MWSDFLVFGLYFSLAVFLYENDRNKSAKASDGQQQRGSKTGQQKSAQQRLGNTRTRQGKAEKTAPKKDQKQTTTQLDANWYLNYNFCLRLCYLSWHVIWIILISCLSIPFLHFRALFYCRLDWYFILHFLFLYFLALLLRIWWFFIYLLWKCHFTLLSVFFHSFPSISCVWSCWTCHIFDVSAFWFLFPHFIFHFSGLSCVFPSFLFDWSFWKLFPCSSFYLTYWSLAFLELLWKRYFHYLFVHSFLYPAILSLPDLSFLIFTLFHSLVLEIVSFISLRSFYMEFYLPCVCTFAFNFRLKLYFLA